ncbi:TapB family protein [Spirosoma lituiforme]
MKTLFLPLLLVVVAWSTSAAQTCMGLTFKSGMRFELSQFNAKDKPIGKINYQINDVRKEGASTVMDIVAQVDDERGKQRPPYTIHYTCTGNELIADMSGMMQAMQNNGMRDTEMKLKTNKLVYPGKLSVGQKLSDGQMEVEMNTNGNTMMTMNMVMANRQVASQAPLTTPAGTFDAYKITSDITIENRVMGMPIRSTMHVVSYRTDNQLFDIKSETYNKGGKLMGYSLLTKVN